MSPKTRSSHQRTAAAPRQTKMAARRTTLVHPRTSPPKLKQRDSTLTQLGFCHSSAPAVETQWTIPVTSDAEDDDDDEGEEPRANKRRKTSGAKAKARGKKVKKDVSESQSTLTQNWRALGYVVDSYDTSDEEHLIMVDEGMQPPPSAQPKQTRPQPRRRPAPDAGETQIQGDNLLGAYLDNDWSSESELEGASNSSLTLSQLAHFAPSQEKDRTRPTTANSNATPKTPKRITKTEIPDSVETSSAPTSTRSTTSGPGHARSPLKERSTNIPTQRRVSQASDKAIRGKASFSQVMLDDADPLRDPVGQWSAKLAFTPKKAQKISSQSREDQQMDSSPSRSQSARQRSGTTVSTVRKRTFERVSTIAESDDSDVELGDIEQPRFGTISRSTGSSAHANDNKIPSQKLVSRSPNTADAEIETVPLSVGLEAGAGSLLLPEDDSGMQTDGEAAERRAADSPSLSQDDFTRNVGPATDRAPQARHADMPVDAAHPGNDAAGAGSMTLADEDSVNNAHNPADARPAENRETGDPITIDDSEAEEEFGGDDDHTEDDLDGHHYEHDEYHDDDEAYTYNQTYDPVADALARDGARAWRTETQLQRDELDRAKEQEALVEESDEDVEEDAATDGDVVFVPSSQDEERVPSSHDFADPGQKLAALRSPGRTTAGDVDDSGYASQEMPEEKATRLLPHLMPPPEKPQQSLPDPPRPSQVSTIGDTQSPLSRPNFAHGIPQPWATEAAPSSPQESDVGLPEDPIERFPQKSYPQTLSSSPFPMPPGVARRARQDHTETQSSGLMDFSLPPPPPLLLSSSSPQEGSSSR